VLVTFHDKTPAKTTSKERRFILDHGFSFHSRSLILGRPSWWKGVEEQSCSPHDSQEAERKRERERREAEDKIYPLKALS
jgi:hypothetical protein